MQRALLIGNGVNRLSSPDSGWYDLIRELRKRAFGHVTDDAIAQLQPLPLVFQACCSQGNETEQKTWFAKEIASKLHDIDLDWHRQLMELKCSDILTTNYDFNLERALEQPEDTAIKFKSANTAKETIYSLFRRHQARTSKGKPINVWHIRGDIDTNISLMLGTSQYAGGLQKLRNFLTQGVNTGNKEAVDGLYRSHFAPHYWKDRNPEDRKREPDSWVNVFLDKQVHAIGFTFDFAEHDLWWLIAEKHHLRERQVLPTPTKYKDRYWDIAVEEEPDASSQARYELLQAFGWQVERIVKPTFTAGYTELIRRLST